jgi:hypothetical protein
MSRTIVASFLATVGIVVPATWHLLDANIQKDGKKLRPLQQQLVVDGARVTLDVDRSVVLTGSKVTARLRAYSDTPRKVAIDLNLLQSNNYAGERVEMPSVSIDHEKFVLDARPDGGPEVSTQLVLGTRPDKLAMTDSFKVFIAPHGEKPPPADEMWKGSLDWNSMIESGKAAAVGITGWSGNSLSMRIVPEGAVTARAPFKVALHIKNTSGEKLRHRPYPSLSTRVGLEGGLETGDYQIEALDEDDGVWDKPFAKNEELVKHFLVTPLTDMPAPKEITFVGQAESYDDAPGPVTAGVMEIKSFKVTEPKSSAVALR